MTTLSPDTERSGKTASQIKTRANIIFAGGSLVVNMSGFGVKDGEGRFQFEEEEIDIVPHDERSGHFYEAPVAKSELIFLRDELLKIFPLGAES